MTEPLKTVLDVHDARADVADLAKVASPLLRELVDHATNAFQRCNSASECHGQVDEDIAPMCLYRWSMEATDALDELLHQSCGPAMLPLVRALFEAVVSLEYVNSDDRERRGLCWVVGNARRRLRAHKAFRPDSAAGKRLASAWASRFGSEFNPPGNLEAVIQSLETLLAKPHLSPVNAEFDRLRGKRRAKEPNWYTAFNGPANLSDLSVAMNREVDYQVLYRRWSEATHAQDLLAFMTTHSRGGGAYWAMRNPITIRETVMFAAELMSSATRTMLARYRPTESLTPWYNREIAPKVQHLAGLQINISPKEMD